MSASSAAPAATAAEVVARIERLPVSWWQVKTRIIIGTATFFDAFDALAIASVLPALVPLWKLTPPQIGVLISAGFLGQLIGALFFGWIAERYGRITGMVWSIVTFAIMSLVCAFAWDYRVVSDIPADPGIWPRRRGADRRGLYQRTGQSEFARPLCDAV